MIVVTTTKKNIIIIQYFTVVAVVNKDSILKRLKHDGTCKYPEEYVLTLEKRLIESFMKAEIERPQLLNETTEAGGTTDGVKAGYVVYIAAAIGSKFNNYSCILAHHMHDTLV